MKRRVFLVIDQLELGGAGRVCSLLANGLVSRGYDVTVCTAIKYHKINYALSEKITIKEWYDPTPIKHSVCGKLRNMYNRCKYYRKALKEIKPTLVIAFTHHIYLYTKLWGWGYKVPIIVSDHTSMGRDLGKVSNFIRHKFYATADAVTILTEKDAKLLGDKLPKKTVIPNPNTFDILQHDIVRDKTILCVGRKDFWKVKGFDRILDIWSRLESKHPEWILKIVGPGSASGEQFLASKAEQLGIFHRVSFIGNTIDMKSIYQSSSIFALPSRVEGFPMVLLEAMSQGCACLSFSMQGAIEEIINQGCDGDIVEDGDLDAFTNLLDALIMDADKRNAYSINARHNIGRFSIDAFIDKWEQIINKVTK